MRGEDRLVAREQKSPREARYALRVGRAVTLQEGPRRACLKVLEAWEEWLRVGHLCDVDGLTRP